MDYLPSSPPGSFASLSNHTSPITRNTNGSITSSLPTHSRKIRSLYSQQLKDIVDQSLYTRTQSSRNLNSSAAHNSSILHAQPSVSQASLQSQHGIITDNDNDNTHNEDPFVSPRGHHRLIRSEDDNAIDSSSYDTFPPFSGLTRRPTPNRATSIISSSTSARRESAANRALLSNDSGGTFGKSISNSELSAFKSSVREQVNSVEQQIIDLETQLNGAGVFAIKTRVDQLEETNKKK